MATAEVLYFMTDFSLLIVVSLILTASAARYCYHGSDISSSYSLKNQSCITGAKSLSNTLFETNFQMSPVNKDEKAYFVDTRGSHREFARETGHLCFISHYVATQVLYPDIKHEAIHVEFGCDLKNICHGKELGKVLSEVTVNGTQGHLFCCDTENCNKFSEFPHLPAENRICYHSMSNKSGTAEKVSCVHPDVMCAKITTFFPDENIESYFCDNDKICQDKMSSGAFRSCHTSNVDNRTQELCCCDASLCFEPPNAESKNTNVSVSHNLDTRTIDKPTAEKDDKLTITGLVAALVFVAGIGGGIIIVMVCKMRRLPRPDPNVIMQYERLSASDVDVNDAVFL